MSRVKELRIEKGWTQADLAEQTGLTRATINVIENYGIAKVKVSTLIALSKALGKSPDYFFAEDVHENEQ